MYFLGVDTSTTASKALLIDERGEVIAELCRREGIYPNVYYRWSKDFLEVGKARLVGDAQLKALVAELSLKNRILTPALVRLKTHGAREKSSLDRETK